MSSVWCLGDNTVDRYVGAIDIALLGGNAVNVAAQLQRRSLDVIYCGAVGSDPTGAWLLERIRRAALSTAHVKVEEGQSAITIVKVGLSGDRHFEREDFGVTATFSPGPEELVRAAQADWVHLGMLPNAGAVKHALRELNPGLRISQDCAVTPGLDNASVVFFSAGEDVEGAKARCLEAFRHGHPKVAVATMGALGSLGFDGHDWYEVGAVETNVVDTTGAGDSYIAGFIEATLEGRTLRDAMQRGARFAAATCTHLGGFPQ